MFIKVASGVGKVVSFLLQISYIFHNFPLLLFYSLFTAASLPALTVLANTGFARFARSWVVFCWVAGGHLRKLKQ